MSADPVLIVVPLLLSWLSSYLTGMVKSSGYKSSWFQPPGWVFGVVWTALYIMLGFLLYESKIKEDYDVLSVVVVVMFFTYLWQFVFVTLKKYKLAIFIIFILLVLSLILYVLLDNSNLEEVYLIVYVPFIAWLIFALLLSANSKYKK
tara:strand:+ start:432 stop:875 length:444 start_codon:yes stop_codon:yes gene_type:complete